MNGVPVTLIDNGMPCVVMKAEDVGAAGYESRDELDGASDLKARIEAIRLAVATACLIEGSPAAQVASIPGGARKTLSVEHPTGEMSCVMETDADGQVTSAAILRTARKLMDGEIFA